jgi:hypothetical protein
MADGSQDPEIKVSPDALTALGRNLRSKFTQYTRDRRLIEEQWMKNLRQYLGQYDPDLISRMDPQQSRAYPKITRVKCVSMVSRLTSLLFPADEKNWSLEASPTPSLPPEALQAAIDQWMATHNGFNLADFDMAVGRFAANAAEKMEAQIDDQLADIAAYGPCDYQTLARRVVRSAVIYGPGIMKGPMTLADTRSVPVTLPDGRITVGTETTYRPYFEYVSNWDYYPDLAAKTFAQMDGQFQRHIFSRHQLRKLAERADFRGNVINDYLRSHADGNYTRQTYETELQTLGEQTNVVADTRKFEVVEYWGYVSGYELSQAGVNIDDSKLNTELKATVWMLDDVVIKAAEDPLPEGASMYHQFVFEEDDVNLMGTGLPEIMRDSQMAVSMASRMLMDNASAVCGPNVEVDWNRLSPGQDTTIKPFKAWMVEPDASQGNAPAVRPVKFDSNLTELQAVVKMFLEFADAETFVNPITGGDMDGSGEALRTTGNMSMVLGNAALPFRDIVRNFDKFTVSAIHSLVEWNMALNPRRDIVGDLRPIGRGATTLIAKEIRAAALDNLANTLLEEEKDYIDFGQLAKQRLLSRDLPLNQIMVSEEVAKQRQDDKASQAQEARDQARRMFEEELKNLASDSLKQASQAQKNVDAADVATFKAVLDALAQGVSPHAVARAAQRTTPAAGGNQEQPRGQAGGAVPPAPDEPGAAGIAQGLRPGAADAFTG